ncbi:PilZ domain-containing protein [Desulfolutivibrio sulfoxidireducens]|uniref:PilZ domain-containing protein n=1 Tax=Desulfolutivibrio sulfoxidireducens TaxID=2773299 RepID=UPI00159EB0D8|nr:PilZ domain-containing protein [Desulfolutivibrio sulfoxidireducens]QLA16059.1 PilZ domain-containing protein [Desulfolutivibrio sulfoxidireducens]QLA20031.1 PilZ domain-containing protein [Desulfolutivibrio sulfoxidireducens]
MDENKRRRSRVEAQFDAYVLLGDDKIPVHTQNISMKGVLCTFDPRLPAGVGCVVLFVLTREIRFRIAARIVRSVESGTAIDFESMDETAFFHLRNIVRYSSKDADRIDRELEIPAFSKKDEGE